ncbi:MAG: SBBP repeat-containing protein [Candidatus Aminicenantaceae bacterium]
MRKFFQIICLIIFGIILTIGFPLQGYTEDNRGSGGISQDIQTQRIQNLEEAISFGEIPLYFIPNAGQVDKRALFYSRTKEYTLWCTHTGLVFDSMAGNGLRTVSTLHFMGAQRAEVVPKNMADYTVSYFKGKNQAEWNPGIQTSGAVLYKGLYKNIDLKLYGNKNQLEYDWIVKKGGDPSQIQFAFDGVKNIRISETGDLVVETAGGQLVHTKPYAYQNIEGEKREVDVSFAEVEKNTYGFVLGDYDSKYDLFIDPLLVFIYASYLGGAELDQAWDITVDSQGRAYITGFTASNDFPTTSGAYNPNHNGAMDVFVTKFNKTGTDLVYSTFIGGSSSDWSYGIAVDADGFVFIAGATASANFPTRGGAFDTSYNGGTDAFVAKLNKNGSDLMLSTFIGGSDEDIGYDLVLGTEGEIFITGSTESADFPTTNGADDRDFGGFFDGFATKFDSEASKLIYSTYIGDEYLEELFGIAVDEAGAAYVTGYIDYDGDLGDGDSDVLAVKLDNKGSKQVYSFIFGGGDDESGRAVVVDELKKAYIVGWTASSNFPTTPEAFDPTYNGHTDAFVCKLKQDGSDFVYCSYLGGTCWDWGEDIDLYDDLSAVVTGYTTTGDFPVTEDAFDPIHNGSADAFVSYVSPDGRDLPYSTFLGGREPDYGTGIAVDVFDVTHTAGYTESANFPSTPDAYNRELNNEEGISDGYYVKFVREWPISLEITYPSPMQRVAGVVPIQTEVIADGEVAWVEFYINNELLYTDSSPPYTYEWDTTSYPNNLNDIKVRASDTEDHRVYATTAVVVLNGTLDLQARRGEYKAWLSRKEYVELVMDVQSSETMESADKYLFLRRKEGENDIYIVKTVRSSELQGSTHTAIDVNLEEGAVYTYWVIAQQDDVDETIVGISEEKTL